VWEKDSWSVRFRPAFAACFGKEPTAPTPLQPSEKVEEFGLDEKQNLVDTLKQFGIKYSEGLASFMEAYGFEDLNMLDECLRLAQVDPGKRKLIVSRWSHHVQKPVPLNLLEKWNQRTPIEIQPPQAFPGQQALTKEDLDKWYAERQKEQEIQSLKAELQELKQQLSEGNPRKPSELEQLREEIRQMRENEILERLRNLENFVHGPLHHH
jgi:ribosomal protein L29